MLQNDNLKLVFILTLDPNSPLISSTNSILPLSASSYKSSESTASTACKHISDGTGGKIKGLNFDITSVWKVCCCFFLKQRIPFFFWTFERVTIVFNFISTDQAWWLRVLIYSVKAENITQRTYDNIFFDISGTIYRTDNYVWMPTTIHIS